MPYYEGRRVSAEEWQRLNGSSLQQYRTGPGGENPGDAPAIDPEIGAPKPKPKTPRRGADAVKAAIADAKGERPKKVGQRSAEKEAEKTELEELDVDIAASDADDKDKEAK